MAQNLIYYFMYFLEALIAFYYLSNVYSESHHSKYSLYISLFLVYALQAWLYSFNIIGLNLALFTVSNLLIARLFFTTSLISASLNAIIMCACMGLSEIVAANLFGGLLSHYNDIADMPISTGIMFILASKLLYFLCLYIISLYATKALRKGTTSKGSIAILLTTFLSFSIFLSLAYISFNNDLTPSSEHVMIIISLLLILFICFTIWIYEHIIRQSEKILILELERQKTFDGQNYNALMLHQAEELKVLRHDIKNHLLAMQEMCSAGAFNDANTYITNLLRNEALTRFFQPTNCDMLNLLLARYYSLCKEKHIAFQVNAQNSDIRFLAFEEITSLFCNLLDNAYEAAIKCSEPFIDLNISSLNDSNKTMIILVNSCETAPIYDLHTKLFTSSKNDYLNHGLGQRSILSTVKKYNGKSDSYYKEAEKEFHTVLYLYSPHEVKSL